MAILISFLKLFIKIISMIIT